MSYISNKGNYIFLWFQWTREVLPQDSKETIIVPIYKKGDKIDKMREISLLPTLCKILSNTLLLRSNAKEIIYSVDPSLTFGNYFVFVDFRKAYDSLTGEHLYDILIKFGISKTKFS